LKKRREKQNVPNTFPKIGHKSGAERKKGGDPKGRRKVRRKERQRCIGGERDLLKNHAWIGDKIRG